MTSQNPTTGWPFVQLTPELYGILTRAGATILPQSTRISVSTVMQASNVKVVTTDATTQTEMTESTDPTIQTDEDPELALILQLGRLALDQIKRLPQPVHNNFYVFVVPEGIQDAEALFDAESQENLSAQLNIGRPSH